MAQHIARLLIRIGKYSIILSIIAVVSCCKNNLNQDDALAWSLELPRVSSPYIYWYGAKTLPIYNNVLISHTTIYDDVNISDNRLCGVGIDTKRTIWYFPDNIDLRRNVVFDSMGYQFGDAFVAKYTEESTMGTHVTSVVCLDIITGRERWIFSEETLDIAAFCPDIVGDGQYCYFINDGTRVYRTNIMTGETSLLYSDEEMRIANAPLILDQNQVGLVRYNFYGDSSQEEVIVINTNTTEVENVISLPRIESLNERSAKVINVGHYLFCNIAHYTFCINIDNREIPWENWNYGYDDASNFFAADDVLFKAGVSSTLAFNVHTGEVLYKYPDLGSDLVSIYDDYVYYITSYGTLLIIKLSDGTIKREIKCPDKEDYFFGSLPVVHDNNLFIMSTTKLHCYYMDKILENGN